MEIDLSRWKTRKSYVSSVVSLSLVLLTLGLALLLVLNANALSRHVREQMGLTLLLKDEAPRAEVERLQKELDASEAVRSTRYVSKDEAARDLRETLGEDFEAVLEHNPLKASIEARVRADHAWPDSLAALKARWERSPLVAEAHYPASLLGQVHDNLRRATLAILGLALLLLLVSVALINNTIRHWIREQRFIIHTQKLVGATWAFIRRPYLLRGLLHGTVGATAASLMLSALARGLDREFPGLVQGTDVALLLGVVLLAGAAISGLATLLAVNSYLRAPEDELHL